MPGLTNVEGNEEEVSVELSRLVVWYKLLGCGKTNAAVYWDTKYILLWFIVIWQDSAYIMTFKVRGNDKAL